MSFTAPTRMLVPFQASTKSARLRAETANNLRECPHQLIIHFVHHFQPDNRQYDGIVDLYIPDPGLSAQGVKDAQEFARVELAKNAFYITHILSSPMQRTVETAIRGLHPIWAASEIPLILLPELQNLGTTPSSVGKPLSELKMEYDGLWKHRSAPVEIDAARFMSSSWINKTAGRWSSAYEKWRIEFIKGYLEGICLGHRGQRVEVVVITHSSLLKSMLQGTKHMNQNPEYFQDGQQCYKSGELNSFVLDEERNFMPVTRQQVMTIRNEWAEWEEMAGRDQQDDDRNRAKRKRTN